MARKEFVIIIAFASMVRSGEIDEIDPKKRDAAKVTSFNTISNGGQKAQDFTYIYNNANPQTNSPNYSYQNQVPNSFYPSQTASQYYTSSPSIDSSSPYSQHSQSVPHSTQQFVPLNFVPNSGYQAKYNIVPAKSAGNVQFAVIQQPNAAAAQHILPYHQLPNTLFPSNHPGPVNHQAIGSIPQYHVAPNYQPISFGNPYLGHPSSLTLLAQPHPSVYSNYLYQNPQQGLHTNYNPSTTQPKLAVSYASSSQQDYEKLQGPVGVTKEENEVGSTQIADYSTQSDASSSYKNAYSNRNSYTKTK